MMLEFVVYIVTLLVVCISGDAGTDQGGGLIDSDCGSKNCRDDLLLECVKIDGMSKCQCENGTMRTANSSESCVGEVGTPCLKKFSSVDFKPCLPNGICFGKIVENAVESICQCKPGFVASQTGRQCLLTYRGGMCTKLDDCDFYAGLKCRKGTCDCDDIDESWDNKLKKCTRRIGRSCDEHAHIPEHCVENGICNNRNTCICTGEFMTTLDEECKLKQGRNCTSSEECHHNFQCNPVGPNHSLICSCRPKMEWYHEEYGHCDRLIGQDCTPNTYCVENAVCYRNKCTCAMGYEPDITGRCVVGYGGDCSRDPNICDKRTQLVCNSERKCECKKFFEYEEESRNCLGLTGASCLLPSDNETSTDFPSDCYRYAQCINRVCECKDGYTKGVDGLCQLSFDQECTLGVPSCNPFEFLHCGVGQRHCSCETTDMRYDEERKSCEAKEGTLCFRRKIHGRQLSCGRNAQCMRKDEGSEEYGVCACDDGFIVDTEGICNSSAGPYRTHPTQLLLFFSLIVSLLYFF